MAASAACYLYISGSEEKREEAGCWPIKSIIKTLTRKERREEGKRERDSNAEMEKLFGTR